MSLCPKISSVPPIVPLSATDVAQIQSSIGITSLQDVILGLVKNSLDANAARIDISFDFTRGSCTVEDDGDGIAAREFARDGGLAKQYWTSKTNRNGLYGCNGTFLWAVAAQSLLTVTSRQISHISLNSAVFHYSSENGRFISTPNGHGLHINKYGTRISVQNLFGNMPVRVKQRTGLDDSHERFRTWKNIKTETVALLLAWSKPTTIVLRDHGTRSTLLIRGNSVSENPEIALSRPFKDPGFALETALNIFVQSSFMMADSWASWVPVFASTSSVSVKGAISLDAAPSKQCQFISLGIEPLRANRLHNELYDEINRIFVNSSFGAIDNEFEISRGKREREQGDKRFSNSGIRDKAVKGIDRWPMFYLRLALKENGKCKQNPRKYFQGDPRSLGVLIDVLCAVVSQWLVKHRFVIRSSTKKHRKKQEIVEAETSSRSISNQQGDVSQHRGFLGQEISPALNLDPSIHGSRGISAFSAWSRIKSSQEKFYEDTLCCRNITSPLSLSTNADGDDEPGSNEGHLEAKTNAIGTALPVTRECGVEKVLHSPKDENDMLSTSAVEGIVSRPHSEDELMTWRHPVTNITFLINRRSGASIPQPGPRILLSSWPFSSGCKEPEEQNATPKLAPAELLLSASCKHGSEASNDWIRNLIDKWDNPVFPKAEAGIPQTAFQLQGDCFKEWKGESSFKLNDRTAAKLSTTGLRKAKVVSQLDGKFILVSMPLHCNRQEVCDMKTLGPRTGLVLIDQHAADERCKLESLFRELCQPYAAAPGESLMSNLGHTSVIKTLKLLSAITFQIGSNESTLFQQHADFFARWGILYDVSKPDRLESGDVAMVTITTLPPGIIERCIADTKLIITLLHTEAWQREHHGQSRVENQGLSEERVQDSKSDGREDKHAWLRGMTGCPGMLIEMLNSRACRSAVMFNDDLEAHECEELVKRLAKCAFPFQCAHGRPSAVPLVELGVLESDDGMCGEERNGGFARAYLQWRQGWSGMQPAF